MAKRPTSQSQADENVTPAPAQTRARRPRAPETKKQNAPEPPGAPVPYEVQSERAHASSEQSIDLDPGPRREALDARTSESPSETRRPTDEDIRVRAYHRYLERGASPGLAFDDWVEAEKELKKR